MKRLHVHITVDDLSRATRFYSTLFGRRPSVEKTDYAKWMLEEGETTCCYARSEKSWISDPAGVPWEVFLTHGEAASYGGGAEAEGGRLAASPTGMPQKACCGG